MSQSSELSIVLQAGAYLIGADATQSSLLSRVQRYHAVLDQQSNCKIDTLQGAQRETANQALHVLERVQCILTETNSPETDGALLGTRDLGTLRVLSSIVFQWGVNLLLNELASIWPSKSSTREQPPIELIVADYKQLSSLTNRLLSLLVPNPSVRHLPRTPVTATLLNRHLPDLFKPSIALGWLPKASATESMPAQDSIRPMIMRLLSMLSPSETITALGAVLSTVPVSPLHVRKTCGYLMSRQLLRPDGVIGLCQAVFGTGSSAQASAPLERLDHFARVLSVLPTNVDPLDYYKTVIPRVIAVLTDTQAPAAYIRASAFSLSRLLTSDNHASRRSMASSVLLPILHNPLLTRLAHSEFSESTDSNTASHATPEEALSILQLLLTNTDPSPVFISSILTPIIPSVYALHSRLSDLKTADPLLATSVHSLLMTWGRVITAQDGVAVLWAIACGEGGDWEIAIGGELKRVEPSVPVPSLSLLTPEDLRQASEGKDLDPEANLLNLRPNPVHFARLLESLNRHDISSELFVRLLEAYRDLKSQSENDPMRALLYLQLIIQLQSHAINSSKLLGQPSTILSFIKHVLVSAMSTSPVRSAPPSGIGSGMTNLQFVSDDDGSLLDSDDSDDEDTATPMQSDKEVLETSLNLLLAILEANASLSVVTSDLNDVCSLLEPIANDKSNALRPLAMEARIVITARLASTCADDLSKGRRETVEESPQETYQKALKLIQDQILPVRAYGLVLLKQLVSSRPGESSALDRALIPGILSVFLQSLQDDDSYIFLNAVQGLAAMVDTYGKDVLKGLVNVYAAGISGADLAPSEIDKRTRVGEALEQVIRRSGAALSIYADIIIPPLFQVVRSLHLALVLRTSALSLLAKCAETSFIALLPYLDDYVEGTIDLLQTESTSSSSRQDDPNVELDSNPSSTDSKLPPLRRAALHFLALMFRGVIMQVHDGLRPVRGATIARARTTLSYLMHNDSDAAVRVMAGETVEIIDDCGQALLGL